MERLRTRAEFLAAQRGARAHGRAVVVQSAARAQNEATPRFGLTVTRKIGTAVERNRIRRRLRAALRSLAPAARPGTDYVLVARREAISMPFDELAADIARALARVHLQDKPPRARDRVQRRAGDDRDVR